MKNDVTQERIPYRRVPLGGAPYRRLIRACGVFAAGAGLVALFGWGLGLPFLASLGAGRIPMAPSTALLFLLFGTAAFVRAREPLSRGAYWMGVAINCAGALAASLLLFLSLEGIHPDAEHLGFPEVSTLGEVPVGHMSPVTAVCFLLASLSFLASLPSYSSRHWRAVVAMCLAGILTAASSVLLLAYLLGNPLFYVGSFIPPAATTSMAFVALGIAMLALAGPQAWPLSEGTEAATRVPYRFVLVFVLLATGIVTAGGLYQRNYEKHYRAGIERQLSAIAELKVGDLVQWRKERMGDAAVFYGNKNFSGLVKRYLDAPGDVDARERIQMWLRQLRQAYQYDEVRLHDAQGVERISVPDTPGPVSAAFSECAAEVLRSGQVAFRDFYRNEHDQRIYLSVLAPILDGQDSSRPLGVLVLRIDPETYLYPLINRWPTPSETAETLIVRREGNEVVFLNELRFQKDAALKLRSPLENVRMTAVQAALGREGIVEGLDYRGVPVVAYVCGIPDSPWFLVARMGVTEIYAPLRQRLWLTIALISALLLGAGAGVGLVWRQQRVRFYQERYEAAEALRESEERHRMTLMSVGDGVIATDAEGLVEVLNPVAEALTGWSSAEAAGRPLDEVFHIINEESPETVENPVGRVLREGVVVGLANHTILIARDGTERPIADSGAPIRNDKGELLGVVLVFRDQTQERAAQAALRRSETLNRNLVEHLPHRIFIKDRNSVYISCNAIYARDLGISPEQIVGKDDLAFHPRDLADHYRADDQAVMASGTAKDIEEKYVVAGEERSIHKTKIPFHDEQGHVIGVLGIFEDITERKRGEERIAHLNRVLRAIRDVSQLIIREKDEKRIIQAACALLVEHRSYCGGMIILCDKTGAPRAYAKAGKSDEAFRPLAEGLKNGVLPLCCEAARLHEGIHHISDRGGVCALCPAVKDCMGGDTLCIRLIHDGVIHGYMAVSMDHAMGIEVEEQTLFAEMAGDIAFALHGMEMEQQRERMEGERLAMEAQLRQQQRLESIGTLAGGVAHEINNPINGIMNYAQLIADRVGDRDESVKEFASEIILETERIASIVKSLLTFARHEKQSYSPARLEDIVNAVLNLVRTLIRHDQITIEVTIPEGLPSLCCRSQQIQQVLLNLVTNARDGLNARFPGYDPEKKLAIYARTFEKDGGLWLRMTVEDHGTGISERSREHVFDPFFTTKPKETGTGLGLSLSHGIVTEHGGQISFESEPNVCTRFHVDLPAAP